MANIFEYMGLANINDLKTESWKKLYDELNQFQTYFKSNETEFRSKEYIWSWEALNSWCRIWEYPYHAHNIMKLFENQPLKDLKILEFGSGVTFFPFYMASKGLNIIATDIDPVCAVDIPKALNHVQVSPGTLSFVLSEPYKINLEDESVDAIYSVSVIEHIPDYEAVLMEFKRILKPGGYIVLTIDVDMNGNYEFKPDNYDNFMSLLHKNFLPVLPEKVIHPLRVLTNKNGPYPFPYYKTIFHKLFKVIIRKIKDLLGIEYFKETYLCIQCMVFKK